MIQMSCMKYIGNKIQDIITFLKKRLPNSEGLVIRPELRNTVRKQTRVQALNICQKYRKLPDAVQLQNIEGIAIGLG